MCQHLPRVPHVAGEKMNQEKLAKLQAQVRIGGKVSGHNCNYVWISVNCATVVHGCVLEGV